ncbi:MAG: hypothetical protein OXC46_12225 [Thaumarchaeota archaeon]|nr:hypothetical protein [Nitrososphaerota archaeon]
MIVKKTKIILFTCLIAIVVLGLGMVDISATQEDAKNPKDKTVEKIQEKDDRQVTLQKIKELVTKENELKEKIESASNKSEKEELYSKLNETRSELENTYKKNHKNDISGATMITLIEQQTVFEENLHSSIVMRFVSNVGIDITYDWWRYYHTPIDQVTLHMGISPVLN